MSYYGSSGDVRNDLNGGLPVTHNNYKGEAQISGTLIERGRRNAYANINGRLISLYPSDVPWASGSEPELVYEISNKLAQCFILNAQNLGNQDLDKNKVKYLCEEPMKTLDDLATGVIEMPEVGSAITNTVYSTTKDYTPVADMDDIENWTVDPDQLDDIADERSS